MLFVVVMGGPGAGKGTQARRLSLALGIPQIASGDLFRENIKERTGLGIEAKSYIDAGSLVPDDITVRMVEARLYKPDCRNGAIFDGFPRTKPQAIALDELLAKMGSEISVVPYIHVDDKILLQRLAGRWTCVKCGHVYHTLFSPPKVEGVCDLDGSRLYQREDDTEETQRRRIKVYKAETAPLLDYYNERELLVEVDGEQAIDEVQEELMNVVQKARTG